MSNNNLQKKAVRAATRFCEHKGYEILDAGWTSPEGTTVDLVAEDEGCLVFIDVAAKEYGEGSLEDGETCHRHLSRLDASRGAGNHPYRRRFPRARLLADDMPAAHDHGCTARVAGLHDCKVCKRTHKRGCRLCSFRRLTCPAGPARDYRVPYVGPLRLLPCQTCDSLAANRSWAR